MAAIDTIFARHYIFLAVVYIVGLCFANRPWCVLSGAIIATTYVGAVLSALYLKRFPFARPHEAGRPIRGYVLSALMAFGCALVVAFGLGLLSQWNIKLTVQLLFDRWWPWSLMAAFTAAVTAYNIDNDERSGQRWVEAILQAAVSAVGALIVYLQLKSLCGVTSDPTCVPRGLFE